MSYYNQLIQFLNQAQTDNLKTKHFDSKFGELDVKVSFGQGNPARIPWISFLKAPNTTSNGIYPVYLYYKEFEILILAFGVSETNIPDEKWDIDNRQSISEYFKGQYSTKPSRYGSSYIFKVYQVNAMPPKAEVDDHLLTILDIYSKQYTSHSDAGTAKSDFMIKSAMESFSKTGLVFSNQLVTRFIASLLTKPFVILTGLSGSGKTKLAQAFVEWICHDQSQYILIPVGADWTNREPLLGYPNALNPEEYVKPDNGALDLILRANDKPELPYFLILDEMNLSHVERYFADFLSVMESQTAIPLYTKGTVENGVPAELRVPSNLFIIGTVNIDETTNMFSPKVLDRASTIEFRVTEKEMKDFLSTMKVIDMKELTGRGSDMANSFLDRAGQNTFETRDIETINEALVEFFGELKKTGAEFGYRSAAEIVRLINQLTILDPTLNTDQKIDIAIMQKMLPKLHGSRRKLCPILEALGSFCISAKLNFISDVFERTDFEFHHEGVRYPLSLEKITRMYRGAVDNGFTSFAEA